MEVWIAILAGLAVLTGVGTIVVLLTRLRAPEGAGVEARLRELSATQSQIEGRFAQAIDTQSKGQSDLIRTLAERMEALDKRLGEGLKDTATKTAETLGGLQARLTIIDEAQKNLTNLSDQVVSLQQIFSDKQSRGAYGQGNMETIIRDALPAGLYEFQATLSNRSRPDCIIRLPNSRMAFVIDAKFPLECFTALKAASGDAERREAVARVKSDVMKHVKSIAEKYLLPGETQDPALMFVPSESIYAELHDSFPELIQQAHKTRVIVVSPNMLMLAITTVQTVLKDARMREQANLIQREVGLLLSDVRLLQERAEKMQRHFGQTEGDVKDILTSAERITRRSENIGRVELPKAEPAPTPSLPQQERLIN